MNPKVVLRPGDVVWSPPGEKHWHGASATTAMTHIAIAEKPTGKSVDYDDQYALPESAG
jgi:quercetin dioxygenase-like cupin family protein